MAVRNLTRTLHCTRYRLAMVCGVKPSTVYASWGEIVPRKHWQRLVTWSAGRLAMPDDSEPGQSA